ncbi:MAG: SDR family NAD(P)-dependent oxidoreductase, partial [Actinomycetota bacterium]
MTSPQHPIDSGHGMRSEPADVLGGIGLSGRHVMITGGYSGLGLETTRALVGVGASVVAPARRPDHARDVFAAEGLDDVAVGALDLGDLGSVEAFASEQLDAGRSIDIMIDNAAIMACPETRVGDGWEAQFATNHLGHFALVNRLWPLIEADGGGRVVSLSSTGHKRSPIRWDDVHFVDTDYEKWTAYGQA